MKLNYYVREQLLQVEVFSPCPGCGRLDQLAMHMRVISYWNNRRKFHVGCNCGWEGPEADQADRAALLWDSRTLINLPIAKYHFKDEISYHLLRHKKVYDDHKKGKTYVEIAKELNITPVRVRQLALRWERYIEIKK